MLGSLFAVAENYPDLKANAGFLDLQQQVRDLEDQVEHARRYYNAVVRDYNTLTESFPANLVAGSFGFTRSEFFEPPPLRRRPPPDLVQGVSPRPQAADGSPAAAPPDAERAHRSGAGRTFDLQALGVEHGADLVAVVAPGLDPRIDKVRSGEGSGVAGSNSRPRQLPAGRAGSRSPRRPRRRRPVQDDRAQVAHGGQA